MVSNQRIRLENDAIDREWRSLSFFHFWFQTNQGVCVSQWAECSAWTALVILKMKAAVVIHWGECACLCANVCAFVSLYVSWSKRDIQQFLVFFPSPFCQSVLASFLSLQISWGQWDLIFFPSLWELVYTCNINSIMFTFELSMQDIVKQHYQKWWVLCIMADI